METETRFTWNIGSVVEFWSDSHQQWFQGMIKSITYDKLNDIDWCCVSYNNGQLERMLDRMDNINLRPIFASTSSDTVRDTFAEPLNDEDYFTYSGRKDVVYPRYFNYQVLPVNTFSEDTQNSKIKKVTSKPKKVPVQLFSQPIGFEHSTFQSPLKQRTANRYVDFSIQWSEGSWWSWGIRENGYKPHIKEGSTANTIYQPELSYRWSDHEKFQKPRRVVANPDEWLLNPTQDNLKQAEQQRKYIAYCQTELDRVQAAESKVVYSPNCLVSQPFYKISYRENKLKPYTCSGPLQMGIGRSTFQPPMVYAHDIDETLKRKEEEPSTLDLKVEAEAEAARLLLDQDSANSSRKKKHHHRTKRRQRGKGRH